MFRPLYNLRKFMNALRGGPSPFEIALGGFIGVILALTPLGWHSILPFAALAVIRCSTGMAFLLMGLLTPLFYLLSGISYQVGYILLEDIALFDPVLTFISGLPVLGLMSFNNYLILGSHVTAVIIGGIIGGLLYTAVRMYRNRIETYLMNQSFVQKSQKYLVVRILGWLFFGTSIRRTGEEDEGSAGETEGETGEEPTDTGGIRRWIRVPVIIGLPILFLILAGGTLFAANIFLASTIESSMEQGLDTDVSIDAASFSPLTRRFGFENILVRDPDEPKKNVFEANQLYADIQLLPLLAGKLHLTEIRGDGFRFHAEREEDGSLNIDDLGPVKPDGEAGASLREWLEEKGREVDWIELIRRYGQYAVERWGGEEQETPAAEGPEIPENLRRSSRTVSSSSPFLYVGSIQLSDCQFSVADKRTEESSLPSLEAVNGQLTHVSTDRSLVEEPLGMDLSGEFSGDQESVLGFEGSIDPPGPEAETRIQTDVDNVNLLALKPLYENTLPVRVLQGRVHFQSTIKFRENHLNAPTDIVLHDLQIMEKEEGQQLMGLNASTTRQAIRGVNAYALENPLAFRFLVEGPPSGPRFHWEADLLAFATRGLRALGEQELQRHISNIEGRIQNVDTEFQREAEGRIRDLQEEGMESILETSSGQLQERLKEKREELAPEDLLEDLKDEFPFGG